MMTKINASIVALTTALTACALDPEDPGVEEARPTCVTDVATSQTECFETFTAAITQITDGRITDAPADARAYAGDAALRDRIHRADGVGAAAAFLLGVQYVDPNFQGNSLALTASRACSPAVTSTPEFQFALPLVFDNAISSFTAANNCVEVLYDQANCTGLHTDLANGHAQANLGAMNDKASCVQFF